MSEMVERVAKAIKAKDYERDNLCSESDCEEFARAAIEAMAKGPTEEMTEHETYTSGQWSRRNYEAIFMKKRLAIMLCGLGSWIGLSMAVSSFPLAYPEVFNMPPATAWRVGFMVGGAGATVIIFLVLACLGAFSESPPRVPRS